MNTTNYILPDVLEHGLITVFCGRAPSIESRRKMAYYAHPTNQFWKILAETGMTDRLLEPSEFRKLPQYGIGLTDLNKTEFGSDHQLTGRGDNPDSVYEKIKILSTTIFSFYRKKQWNDVFDECFWKTEKFTVDMRETGSMYSRTD